MVLHCGRRGLLLLLLMVTNGLRMWNVMIRHPLRIRLLLLWRVHVHLLLLLLLLGAVVGEQPLLQLEMRRLVEAHVGRGQGQ